MMKITRRVFAALGVATLLGSPAGCLPPSQNHRPGRTSFLSLPTTWATATWAATTASRRSRRRISTGSPARGCVSPTHTRRPRSARQPAYAILTGRYSWRTRLERGVLGPWDKPLVDADRLTVASLLKRHGYATACIGKWHLGWTWPTKDGRPPESAKERLSNVDFTRRSPTGRRPAGSTTTSAPTCRTSRRIVSSRTTARLGFRRLRTAAGRRVSIAPARCCPAGSWWTSCPS